MIELPEASLVASQMNKALKGKVIVGVQLKNCDKLSRMGSVNVAPDVFEARSKGKSVDSVASRDKWIFVKLRPDMNLVLGEIIGRVLFHRPEDTTPDKFHLKLRFTDGSHLMVSSAR